MKGVRCSWVDMKKIQQALSAKRRGDQKQLEYLRCVDKATVSRWRAACDVLDAVEDKVAISQLSHVQPSHAEEIARAFRRKKKDLTDEEVKNAIAEIVDHCEQEELTVEELREALCDPETNGECDTPCQVSDLQTLIKQGKTFGTIYVDPPWKYGNQRTRAATGNHYNTWSVEKIATLPVAQLAAKECHLHLWTTNAFLFECPKLFKAWGFEYKSVFVWVKPQMGIGNYWRVSHEFLLLAVRGKKTFRSRKLMSWIREERTKHSAKPHAVRKMIEQASPGPRLELFGRHIADGWTVWGNQIERGMFNGDIKDL